jgi:prepilin-type N-terminal cleavage/methylation domain-containing protein
MASRRTSTTNGLTAAAGFTLIEMLIVIGLISALGAVALFVDLNSYRGDAFRAERTTLVTLLEQARADSLNNVGQTQHGVALFPSDQPGSYVLFDGASYVPGAAANRVFPASYLPELVAGSPTAIVFEQLSGDVLTGGTITLRDPGRNLTAAVTINHEGAIIW